MLRGPLGPVLCTMMLSLGLAGCAARQEVHDVIVIDPGHFHAGLVLKDKLPGLGDTVRVYAPQDGPELRRFVESVPEVWTLDITTGPGYLDSIPQARAGAVAVLAGDNLYKARYISAAVSKGYNVLSDKPMAITLEDFVLLDEAYGRAADKGLVIMDMMTERHDLLNIIARRIVSDTELLGAVVSVDIDDAHHFYKNVSGKPLTRPVWYYDVTRQGEGIVDVTTHFIDLVAWMCFPDRPVGVSDISGLEASHWPTMITAEQFALSTGASQWPGSLAGQVHDGVLPVMCNGCLSYDVFGIGVSIRVRWDFEAPPGGGDSFNETVTGATAVLEIVQDSTTGFVRQMYVRCASDRARHIGEVLSAQYPFVSVVAEGDGRWLVDVPAQRRSGHEEHFSRVLDTFIGYLDGQKCPRWESTNALTKYYITTRALGIARAGAQRM